MTLPDELEAKQEILQVLGHLGDSAQRRVTSWVHQRILGDLLTSLVGGVLTSVVGGAVNEPIRFDLKVLTYRLAEPASALRSIEGTSSGLPRTFLVAIDFVFSGTASNTVAWLDEGTKPDGDTTFFVDYLGVESRSPLSDLKVGSVTRALAEAVARELATLYEQLNLTYQSARGRHLLPRPRAGLQHHHPAGTRLVTTDGSVVFVSMQPRTLQSGQVRIDVPVRADVGFAGKAGLVDAGTITETSHPVAGIGRVANLEPTTIRRAANESDDELRLRARAALTRSARQPI